MWAVAGFALALLVFPAASGAQMESIAGNWLVTATLIATSQQNPQLPAGYAKQENWSITQQGSQAAINAGNVSLVGQYFQPGATTPSGSWQFAAENPSFMNQPNLGVRYEAIINTATAGELRGLYSVTFYNGNQYTNQWSAIGGESWSFIAVRAQ